MAILTARSVQSLLDESASFLTNNQVEALARRLNLPNQALAAEWELITLSAMSYVGTLIHEPPLAGTRRLDFQFDQPASGLKVVGDITTLSDDAIQKNSVDYLSRELPQFLDKRGIRGSLSVGIDCEAGTNDSIVPRLPDPHNFRRYIFDAPEFIEFVAKIRGDLSQTQQVRIDNDHAGLTIIYSPGQWRLTFRYSEIRLPRHPEKNVVFKALKDKSSQINASGHTHGDGWRCVVLCDGNCAALSGRSGWGTHSRNGIIASYLRRHKSLDLVVCLSVEEVARPFAPATRRSWEFVVDVLGGESCTAADAVQDLVKSALERLPVPVRHPVNAKHYVGRRFNSKVGLDGARGSSFGVTTFSVSSRALSSAVTSKPANGGHLKTGQ